MIRRPPRSTRTDTLFPYTTLFRALLALGFEAIDQQRVIERFALAAMAPAIGRQRRELVVVEAARIVQQASDQRALAILVAAARDVSQQDAGLVLALVGGEVDLGVDGLGETSVLHVLAKFR